MITTQHQHHGAEQEVLSYNLRDEHSALETLVNIKKHKLFLITVRSKGNTTLAKPRNE